MQLLGGTHGWVYDESSYGLPVLVKELKRHADKIFHANSESKEFGTVNTPVTMTEVSRTPVEEERLGNHMPENRPRLLRLGAKCQDVMSRFHGRFLCYDTEVDSSC